MHPHASASNIIPLASLTKPHELAGTHLTFQGTSGPDNGGFTYDSSGLPFENSPNKIKWRWQHEAEFRDLDGSLTGQAAGSKAVAKADFLPTSCSENAAFSVGGLPGAVCPPDVNFHR